MRKSKKPNFYILTTVLTLAALLFSIASVVSISGKTYTIVFDQTINSEYFTEDDITVWVGKDEIVEIDDWYLADDHSVCVKVHSLDSGTTDVFVRIKGSSMDYSTKLYVNMSGTVIQPSTLNFTGYRYAQGAILFGFAFTSLMMILAYIDCWKKARFDYSMIAYGGVAIFSAAMSAYPLARLLSWLPTHECFRYFINDITEIGLYFVLVTTPVMLIVCIAFAFSNIWLIRHEGFRPVNLLGIVLGVTWFIGAQIVINRGLFWFIKTGAEMVDIAYYATAYGVSLMICLLFSVMVSAILAVKYKPAYDKEYLIILGCCIRSNGDLTPLLRGRVDSALDFEKKQFAATGRHAKFVPSGGQGPDEVISESEAMKRYLLAQGVPEDSILKEDKSVNTDQNIAFSREVIEKDCEDIENVKAAFATTNYHVLRGNVLSKKHNLNAQGISAKTKWYFFPNAFLREFVGLLAAKKLAIGIILVAIILSFWFINRLLTLI